MEFELRALGVVTESVFLDWWFLTIGGVYWTSLDLNLSKFELERSLECSLLCASVLTLWCVDSLCLWLYICNKVLVLLINWVKPLKGGISIGFGFNWTKGWENNASHVILLSSPIWRQFFISSFIYSLTGGYDGKTNGLFSSLAMSSTKLLLCQGVYPYNIS